MPDPNVTIRHARHAIYMVINGAVRDIEAVFAADDIAAYDAAITLLFQNVIAEVMDWDIDGALDKAVQHE